MALVDDGIFNWLNPQHLAGQGFHLKATANATVSTDSLRFRVRLALVFPIAIAYRSCGAHINAGPAGHTATIGELIGQSQQQLCGSSPAGYSIHKLSLNLFASIQAKPAGNALIGIKS